MARPQSVHRAQVDVPRWIAAGNPGPFGHQMPSVPSHVISFDTTEGTFMNVDVSPDGETLIFDLLGDIYWLPMTGGDAVALTSGRAWDHAPRFSPDGGYVYFVSDRKGFKNIWRLSLADQSVDQVTRSDSDILGGPNWSQDGNHLLASVADAKSRHKEFILQSIDPISGNMTPIDAPSGPWIDSDTFEIFRPRTQIFSGVESADGTVYFSKFQPQENSRSRGRVRISMYDRDTRRRASITLMDASYSEYKLQLSPDGSLLAYFRQYDDRRTEIRTLNRMTRQDRAVIELANADDAYYGAAGDTRPNYAFTPDGRELIFWHGGKIYRVRLADGSRDIIPFRVRVERAVAARVQPTLQHLSDSGDEGIIRWPSLSRDGQRMAFAAIGYVWVMDITTGHTRRLTHTSDFEYMPMLSPSGKSVAYVSFAQSGDYGSGRLMVANVNGGMPREVLAGPNETYLLPKWSQDGEKIAVIKEAKSDGGLEATFGWTRAARGAFQEVASGPSSSDPSSWHIYARFVGFDEAGCHLLFSFPRSRNETLLMMAGLRGGQQRTLAVGTRDVGGISPAPDLKNLAVTRRDGTVWVVPFDSSFERRQVSTSSPDARRISDGGGYYVDWNRPDRITFGFGQNVYRHALNRSGTESLRVKLAYEKPRAPRPIAFNGARLITMADDDGAGPVIETGTIVVRGPRIIAVGPTSDVAIPSDARVIDAAGETIMPGLLDTHYHRIGGGTDLGTMSAVKLPNSTFGDRTAIAYGITTAWEPGGPADDGVPATVDLQAAGRIAGPRWSHSAMGTVGSPFELLTSYSSALAAVEQHRELGVNVLKEAHTPTRRQRQWLASAARQLGVGIVSHLESFDGTMTRIIDGYSGGEHPYIPAPFFKDVYELLRQTGYIWTPNIVITTGVIGNGRDVGSYYCHEVALKRLKQRCDNSETPSTVPYADHRVHRVAEQVTLAERKGTSIGVSGHAMSGLGLHMEMWYLWKGGMPIEDVLRATTIVNAKKLGLQEEIGSLAPGKIADFLVLDENPLDDILNALSLKYTVQGGVVYDSDTALVAELNGLREADVATLHPEE